MMLLRNPVVLKLAIGALGLLVGIGGVTAGANYHPAQQPVLQRTFVGTIIAVGPRGFTLRTRGGKDVRIAVFPRTTVAHRGRVVPHTDLRVGDVVLVQCRGGRDGIFNAYHIRIPVLANPTAQGP